MDSVPADVLLTIQGPSFWRKYKYGVSELAQRAEAPVEESEFNAWDPPNRRDLHPESCLLTSHIHLKTHNK